MDEINIICDFGFIDIKAVEGFLLSKDIITIHQVDGGIISLKRSNITRLLYNGKELINENR